MERKRSGLVAPQPAKRGVFGKCYRLMGDRSSKLGSLAGVATRVPTEDATVMPAQALGVYFLVPGALLATDSVSGRV